MDRLNIPLKVSRHALLYCSAITALAAFAITQTALPVAVQVVLLLIVLFWGIRTIYAVLFPIFSTLQYRSGEWYLYSADEKHSVKLAEKIFIGAGLIVLPWVFSDGKKGSLLLWPDSAASDDLRCLRLLLLAKTD
jgi:hypothetical protein